VARLSITARILSWLTVLVIIAVVVLGVAAAATTRAAMISQLDETVSEAASRPARPAAIVPPEPIGLGGRAVAILEFDSDGALVAASPSGFAEAPDALPAISDPSTLLDENGQPDQPVTVAAVDDAGLRYRAVAYVSPRGITVAAAPMDGVDELTQSMVAVLVLIGSVVIVALLAGAWFVIKRGLRPVNDIAVTAEAFAEGDLSQRTEHADTHTEVGQLGASFNYMADEVEAAFVQRQDTEDRLRQFVADASHELRTPLVAVRGYAELYRAGALDDPVALSEAMRRTEGETKRMGRLIDDLLTLARLDQRQHPSFEDVDLVRLGSDAVADARAVEPDRPIEFVHDEVVVVRGDADQLRQVFGNLLANARVHTPPATPVRVEVDADEDACLVIVSDEGPGIDPEQLEHVFDRFYRADTTRSRQQGGTGLGLSIVAAVAASHGGLVTAESDLGVGTQVIVTIPRQLPSGQAGESRPHRDRPS
jgi:two-component system OmpR family sensor kinase